VTPSIAVPTLWALLDAARARDVDVEAVVRDAALAAEWLGRTPCSLDRRLPLASMDAAWTAIMRRLRDPGFPVFVGRRIRLEDYQLFGFLIRTSADIGDAFERVGRYSAVWTEGGVFRVEEGTDRCAIVYEHRSEGLGARCAVECIFTEIVALSRAMTGQGFADLEVELAHDMPGGIDEHLAFFRAPLRFGRGRNALVTTRAWLRQPLPARDATMAHYLEEQAEALLASFADRPVTKRRVCEQIVQLLPGGDASLGRVARALGTSERTLRRRLAEEEASFEDLLRSIRIALAQRYLRDPGVSVAEIALLLGFSDPTAFHRAFRRWVGETPGAFRTRPA